MTPETVLWPCACCGALAELLTTDCVACDDGAAPDDTPADQAA